MKSLRTPSLKNVCEQLLRYIPDQRYSKRVLLYLLNEMPWLLEFRDNTRILIWLASFHSFDSCTILENSVYYAVFLVPEAVAQMCSVKKVLLEVSQSLQENTCARVSFLIKFFSKRDPGTGVLQWVCDISKNIFFTEHPWCLWFILIASIIVTWVSWFSGHMFKLEAEDFIFHILHRNSLNFGVKILALCSAKSLRGFYFSLFRSQLVYNCWKYGIVQNLVETFPKRIFFFFFYSQVANNCSN